ncbi:siderophore-interacting protein [Corynebacterium hansenii]|uniref:Siderophore-interacting protein n=1 Tax=Corynebacterium hansenii TaxID=394964 RepID=A0ABV7ZM30_9CORY|nr:siderophore-interacting protein [Corynebacterium hansenii]WJY99618.1 Vibriobactin utilization protein ViuB [Corynebacterium hansenii]
MARIISTFTVTASDRISPTMQRVTFDVSDIAPFAENPHTDAYVKLLFDTADAATPAPDAAPTMRTYTVHSIDAEAGTLAIDFALHGDGDTPGIASAWAVDARPGDIIDARGPGGAYSPDPAAAHHLICGDATAIPAIAAAVRELPADASADVVVEAPDYADVDLIPNHPGASITHVTPAHGTDAAPGDALVEMTTAIVGKLASRPTHDPAGIQVFVHGEAHAVMKRIRPMLKDAGIPVRGASISGYWRVGRTEEGFRTWKKENRPADD